MMMQLAAGALIALTLPFGVQAQGDPQRGAEAFRQCAACHTLEPGRHRTGPSLAGVIGRKAGKTPGFRRYSAALRESGISWTEAALDSWLKNPGGVVPGTSMRIQPVADRTVREDIIAFLKTSGASESTIATGPGLPNLKQVQLAQRVTALRYCPDAYWVTFATGQTLTYWEFNLRFKTDSSVDGPLQGQPVFVGQGMQGDRAQVVFAGPAEIGSFIKEKCIDD